MDADRFQYLILAVICFVLALSLTAGLTGCATDTNGYYQAETQRHLAASSPIFACEKCEGVVLRSQIPQQPTPKPTNGYDMVMGISNNLVNLAIEPPHA